MFLCDSQGQDAENCQSLHSIISAVTTIRKILVMLQASNNCGGILTTEEPSIGIGSFLNREFRLWIVIVGLIGTLMPWYVREYGIPSSVNLLDMLVNPGSLELMFASLSFYAGLAACAMRYVRWSIFGEMCMIPAVAVGLFSMRGWSIGAGQVVDWIVMIVIGIVIYARTLTY